MAPKTSRKNSKASLPFFTLLQSNNANQHPSPNSSISTTKITNYAQKIAVALNSLNPSVKAAPSLLHQQAIKHRQQEAAAAAREQHPTADNTTATPTAAELRPRDDCVAPTATPTTVALYRSFVYAGCWTDDVRARALPDKKYFDQENMTVEKCIDFCTRSSESFLRLPYNLPGSCFGGGRGGNRYLAMGIMWLIYCELQAKVSVASNTPTSVSAPPRNLWRRGVLMIRSVTCLALAMNRRGVARA